MWARHTSALRLDNTSVRLRLGVGAGLGLGVGVGVGVGEGVGVGVGLLLECTAECLTECTAEAVYRRGFPGGPRRRLHTPEAHTYTYSTLPLPNTYPPAPGAYGGGQEEARVEIEPGLLA